MLAICHKRSESALELMGLIERGERGEPVGYTCYLLECTEPPLMLCLVGDILALMCYSRAMGDELDNIIVEVVDKVPDKISLAHRDSTVHQLIRKTKASPTGIIKVTSEDKEALIRIYKTIIQWRSRHKSEGLEVRKSGDTLYLWFKNTKNDK